MYPLKIYENLRGGWMRTPNTKCIICGKPLYRRPYELAKARYVACYEHREIAKKQFPLTDKQLKALELGRTKGDNHLRGIPKSKESNQKRSESHKKYCSTHPDKVAERGKKIRGENHYKWKGGSSKLNISIRTMTENRKWMDAIKARDNACVRCGSRVNLESHHIIPLAELIEKYNIKNREDARKTPELWNLENGITLCQKCHYTEHGRNNYED